MGEESWDEYCAWRANWSEEENVQEGSRLCDIADGAAAEFIGMQLNWPKDRRVDDLWPEEPVLQENMCMKTIRTMVKNKFTIFKLAQS